MRLLNRWIRLIINVLLIGVVNLIDRIETGIVKVVDFLDLFFFFVLIGNRIERGLPFALILRFRAVAAAVVFFYVEVAQIDERVNPGSNVYRVA